MTDPSFATHKQRLATDDAYRRRFGLAPLPSQPTEAEFEQLRADVASCRDGSWSAPAAPSDTNVDPGLFRRLRALKDERAELRRRDKELTAEIDSVQERLVEQYTLAGTTAQEFDGYTGSLNLQLWARKRDESVAAPDVAAALRADGLAHLVTPEGYHSQRLSAYLRDLDAARKPIPPHLAELIEATEVPSINFTTRRPSRARRRLSGAESTVLGEAGEAGNGPGAS